jgi:hypothetical protein
MSKFSRRARNSIGECWIAHTKDMRESLAWQLLPDNARRILDRLELEHMRHGAGENGKLPCTYSDFASAGIRRASVSLAIRQCVRLGFLKITNQGGRSISNQRWPSLYLLTYVTGCKSSPAPTHDWRSIKTTDDARQALATAAIERDHRTQPRPRNVVKFRKPDTVARPGPDAVARL